MKNYIIFILVLLGALLSKNNAATLISSKDSLYFFYERTIYLENLNQPGAWWANPGLLANIDSLTVITYHTGPLDGNLTLAAVKFAFPLGPKFRMGLGATGAGGDQKRLFSVSGNGAEYKSNFVFAKPSLEIGLSFEIVPSLIAGIMNSFGTEQEPYYGTIRHSFSEGIAVGLIASPHKSTTISLSTFSNIHFSSQRWWNHGIKSGIFLQSSDSALQYVAEYSGTLSKAYFSSVLHPDPTTLYTVYKTSLVYNLYSSLGVNLGYSTDSFSGNFGIGRLLHAGAELRKNSEYNYFGGYEIGASLNRWPSIVHKLWVGYKL